MLRSVRVVVTIAGFFVCLPLANASNSICGGDIQSWVDRCQEHTDMELEPVLETALPVRSSMMYLSPYRADEIEVGLFRVVGYR